MKISLLHGRVSKVVLIQPYFYMKKQICINFYKKILNLLKFVYIIIKNEKIMKNSEEKE